MVNMCDNAEISNVLHCTLMPHFQVGKGKVKL